MECSFGSNSSSSTYSESSYGGSSNQGSSIGSTGQIPEDEVPVPSHFSDWGTSSESYSDSTSTNTRSPLVRSEGSMNLSEKAGMIKSNSANFPSSTVIKEYLPKSFSDNFFYKKN